MTPALKCTNTWLVVFNATRYFPVVSCYVAKLFSLWRHDDVYSLLSDKCATFLLSHILFLVCYFSNVPSCAVIWCFHCDTLCWHINFELCHARLVCYFPTMSQCVSMLVSCYVRLCWYVSLLLSDCADMLVSCYVRLCWHVSFLSHHVTVV